MAEQPALGLVISQLRSHAGLTQQELASKLSMTQNFIWMVENGERNVSHKSYIAFAKVLNIEPSYLNILATNPIKGAAGNLLEKTQDMVWQAIKFESEN